MKKSLKILRRIVFVIFGLLILVIAGLWLFFPVEKAKEYAIEKGSSELGRPITIEKAEVSFWGGIGIKLQHVAVSNPEGFEDEQLMSAEDVDVKLQIFPLLFGEFALDRLIVNKPVIRMQVNEDGSNNFSFEQIEKRVPQNAVEQTTPETKAAAAAVSFEQLEINEGLLSYVNDSSNLVVDIVGLDLNTSLRLVDESVYHSSGEVAINSISVKNGEPLPEVSLTVDYDAEYNVSDKQLQLNDSRFSINDLVFVINGAVDDPFGGMSAKVHVKTDRVKVRDLFSMMPKEKMSILDDYKVEGDFSADIDVEYDNSKEVHLVYYGTAIFADVTARHKEIAGELSFEKALLDIKNDNLRFNIEDGAFDGKPFKGHLIVDDFDNPDINGAFAGSLNLVYLHPFLPVGQNHTLSGLSDFDIKISGHLNDYERMKFSGKLRTTKASYNADFMLEAIDTLDMDLYFDNNLISVKKFKAISSAGYFDFSGRLTSLLQYYLADTSQKNIITPTVDGKLKGDLDLSILTPLLPKKGSPKLAGQFLLDMKLTGAINDLSNLEPRGAVTIKNGSYSDSLLPEPIQSFEAQFTVAPDTITVKRLFTKFVSSDVSFSGQLIRPFPYLLPVKNIDRTQLQKPLFIFSATSTRFDSDRLFPEAVPGAGEENAVTRDSVSTIILPDIDGRGVFEIDTLIYSKVVLTDLTGKIKIYNRKIECYDVLGKAYTGSVSGKTTIDLTDFNNPKYIGEFDAKQIEANEFMHRFSKYSNMLYGKVDFKGTYTASGWEPEQFLNSLNMKSSTAMVNGKLMTSGETFTKLSKVVEKMGKSFSKEQTVRNLFTNVAVKDGKVWFKDLKTAFGEFGDLSMDGFYGFDGKISYDGKIKLSEATSKKLLEQKSVIGEIGSFLSKDASIGRITLPLKYSGSIDKPEFNLDVSELTKSGLKGLQDLFKK